MTVSTIAVVSRSRLLTQVSVLIGLWGLASLPAWAAGQPASPAPTFSPLASLGQLIFGLALVVGLIFAASWLMKKVGLQTARTGGFFKPLAHLAVGQREKIMLIEAGEQWLIIGVTAQQITPLATLPKGDATLLQATASNSANAGNAVAFAQLLQKFRQR
ncbi:flagellar biosynthetic protein FliO [Parvibium lacunae]|uniref:Flagellar protein n=1 Tax=Parvibium lacunae TaxID=1888893 RepID=A0A368L474_9BURK|nr:flagellar biosynthetic protein FliO [Parvibium lacunae]RCS58325.1 flagellar biosynthetic protein FliO [Parvibium lacunae]